MELLNLLLALALVGGAWFATVRILAWTMTRDAARVAARRPMPANRRARTRHFVAGARHPHVR